MEKQKNLELVFNYAQNLGLSPKEVLTFFAAKAEENASFMVQNNVNSKGGLEKVLPCSGMFYYEDNTFSFKRIANKVVSGIVVYVEASRALIVCLEEKRLVWSTDSVAIYLNRKELSGYEATQNILKEISSCHQKAEAAKWCAEFAQNGVKQGEAFLPSTYELIKISDNRERINKALKELDLVSLSGLYWSSNEANETSAILVRLADAQKQVFPKDRVGGFVRPVFWREF